MKVGSPAGSGGKKNAEAEALYGVSLLHVILPLNYARMLSACFYSLIVSHYGRDRARTAPAQTEIVGNRDFGKAGSPRQTGWRSREDRQLRRKQWLSALFANLDPPKRARQDENVANGSYL